MMRQRKSDASSVFSFLFHGLNEFKLLLEDRSISVLAYNLETIMAEKLETVISRGDQGLSQYYSYG